MKHNHAPRSEAAPVVDQRDVLTSKEMHGAVKAINEQLAAQHGKHGYELSESASFGAIDSAHGVFFARHESPTPGMPEALAIKRFRRQESAERELESLYEAQRRGFKTVEPVGDGLVSLGDAGTALVTARIPRFTTMNHVGWQDAQLGDPSYDEAAGTLSQMAAFAGKLHGAGMVHNDMQVKNFGQNSAGEFIVFDVEGMKFYDPTGPDTGEGSEFAGGCLEDLKKMTSSLLARGFLAGVQPRLVEEEIANQILAPYFDNGGHPSVMDQYDNFVADVMQSHANAAPMNTTGVLGRVALK